LGYLSKRTEIRILRKYYPRFMSTLLTIAMNGEKSECPSMNTWIKNVTEGKMLHDSTHTKFVKSKLEYGRAEW
jgi:hypothetical protein